MDRDDFESWIFSIDSYLEELNGLMPTISSDLNYSACSLSKLENYLLSKFSTIDELISEENKCLLNACSVYVGETFRKKLGGKWDIILDDEKNVFYKLPILRIDGLGTECPLSLVTASIDRRKGSYIEDILGVFIEDQSR